MLRQVLSRTLHRFSGRSCMHGRRLASTCKVSINGTEVDVAKGTTVLDACKQQGIDIPTLCYHPRLKQTSLCRICLFEAGDGKLKPACSTVVTDGMTVQTNSKRVDDSIRGDLQLILKSHPNACMTCEVNGKCELQTLVRKFQVEDSWPTHIGDEVEQWRDLSTEALSRDLSKCIKCSRCISACADIQDLHVLGMINRGDHEEPVPSLGRPLSETDCILCGQCSVFCPTGAIIDRPDYHHVWDMMRHRDRTGKVFIAQAAPSVRVALGEEFGLSPGSVSTPQMTTALRKLGFDYVFDTGFTADLTIMEESQELIHRIQNGGVLPLFTSCCPGWVNLVEGLYPQLIPHLSSCRSPQQMAGSLTKKYFADVIGKSPDDVIVTSVMPCTAKKHEANRPEFATDGTKDVDFVITTRELASWIRQEHIPYSQLEEGQFDSILGESTGAAMLFGASGGVLEAALRTAYHTITGSQMPTLEVRPIRGMQGCREAEMEVPGVGKLKVAVINGTGNIRKFLKETEGRLHEYAAVEYMACPAGCIGGGGQPKSPDADVLRKRVNAVYSLDERYVVRESHKNKEVANLYDTFLGKPGSHKSHELLHTTYTAKSKSK